MAKTAPLPNEESILDGDNEADIGDESSDGDEVDDGGGAAFGTKNLFRPGRLTPPPGAMAAAPGITRGGGPIDSSPDEGGVMGVEADVGATAEASSA